MTKICFLAVLDADEALWKEIQREAEATGCPPGEIALRVVRDSQGDLAQLIRDTARRLRAEGTDRRRKS